MKIVVNNIILLLLLAFYCRDCDSDARQKFSIGGLLHENDEDVKNVLACTIQMNNYDYQMPYRYKDDFQIISENDVFSTSQSISKMLQASENLVAVVGPRALPATPISQSILSASSVPHIQFVWKPEPNKEYTNYINMYPQADLLAEGLATIIRHMNWKSFVILYEEDEGLIRLQEVLKLQNLRDINDMNTITVRQLGPGPDYRTLLKEIKNSTEGQILLDCRTDKIIDILSQAKEVNLLGDLYNYFITSLDAHTLDLTPLETTANITTWRLVDPSNEEFVGIPKRSDAFHCSDVLFPEAQKVRMEEALIFDGMSLLINSVVKTGISSGYDPSQHKWNEGIEVVEQMKRAELKSPLTGPMAFDEYGNRIGFSLQIVELLRNGVTVTSMWHSNNPDKLNMTLSEAEKSQQVIQSLQQTIVKVSSRIGPPYLKHATPKNGEVLTGNARYEGYSMDLIAAIANILNFTFEFELAADGKYGNYDPKTKSWNGLIKDLLDRRAHLAICDLTITHQRREVVDFSMPFMTLGISILYKKAQKEETSMFAFMEPLSFDVWIYTATLYLAVSIMLYIVARMAPGDWENPHPCDQNPEELENIWDLKNCLWLTLGSIMTQGCDILPKGISSRMVTSMWWFFSLIMTSSYTANMAAFLTKERMGPTIDSAEALAKQTKIKYGTVDGGATQAFFRDSNFSTYQRMWTQMQSSKPTVFEKSNADGVKRVQSTNNNLYAFLMESSSIEYEVEKNCDLKQVGAWLDNKGYGIAMPVNSPYRTEINRAVLKLQESGELSRLKNRWWKEKNEKNPCSEPEEEGGTDSSKLSLSNVGGVFLVLGVGVAIAFILSSLEFLWNVHNVSVDEKITFWEALKIELKFAVSIHMTKKRAKPQISESSSSSGSRNDDIKSIAHSVLQEAGSLLNIGILGRNKKSEEKD